MRRIGNLAVVAAILSILPALAGGASLVHVKWEDLAMVTGKTVSIAVPGGGVITGKAVGVESDALVVKVTKTTDPKGWPKGERRVPRENLRVLRVRSKGNVFQILGTTLGVAGGLVGGAYAAFVTTRGGTLDEPLHNADHAVAAFVGVLAGGASVGYFAGNAADTHWTTVEILP